jgi:ribosomal protein S10
VNLFFVVAVVAVVAMAVSLLIRRSGRGRTTAATVATAAEQSVPTFDIVALGLSGSGKTVFLSSMFHELHVALNGRPYHLQTDATQRVMLSSTLTMVADTLEDWPRGTTRGDTREFSFDCVAEVGDTPITAFRINYVDYAGEIFERVEHGASGLHDIEARIKAADTLLGILDGARVVQYLRGEAAGRAHLNAAIQPLIGMMSTARCPVYLVVTKWDLVRGFGEPDDAGPDARLDLVNRALFEIPQLRALLRRGATTRVIPVSAVGTDFAVLDPASGEVVKRADGSFRPVDVEVPLAAAIPDVFARVEAAIDARTREQFNRAVAQRLRIRPADSWRAVAFVLSRPIGLVVRGTLDLALGKSYSSEVVAVALDWIGRPIQQQALNAQAARTEGERQIALTQQARRLVLNDMQTTLVRFEARLPSSRPAGGR